MRLTTSPHVPNVMEMWEPKPPGNLWATPGLLRDCFTFTFYIYTYMSTYNKYVIIIIIIINYYGIVLTEAIPLCDIISIYIFTSYTTLIKLTKLSATT